MRIFSLSSPLISKRFVKHNLQNTTETLPHVGRPTLALLLFVGFGACLTLHLRGIGGDFLSDDFSHVAWISDAQTRGALLEWVLARFYLPLDSGNYAYRPVVFASYSLDWLLYGTNVTGWHLTNLIIHLFNGVLMLIFAKRLATRAGLADAKFVAVAAATLLIAIPFAGESTFWPVGRFDLLACAFSLAFLMLLLTPSAAPGGLRIPALLACVLLALLSKESAMPMLAVGLALLFACNLAGEFTVRATPVASGMAASRKSMLQYWPVIALSLAYFAWRYFLFGSPWKVYPDSHFPRTVAELMMRIETLKYVFAHPYAEYAGVWIVLLALAAAVWLAGLASAARQASFLSLSLVVTLFGCAIVYLLAPATSFPLSTANGEGIRNLYLPWTMFSLFAAFAVAHHRVRVALLCVSLVVAFWGQWRLVTLWQESAREMARVTTAVPVLAKEISDAQYALLLLPDHLSAVPFVRNAQGGVVVPPRQTAPYLHKMAAFTPQQFAEWERHFANNQIGELKGNGTIFDRTNFAGVYCWVKSQGRFQLLDSRPHANAPKVWEDDTMKSAARSGCML